MGLQKSDMIDIRVVSISWQLNALFKKICLLLNIDRENELLICIYNLLRVYSVMI